MTTLTPYRPPAAGPDRDRFARLVRAEWTKFRTVRGWVAAVLVAGLLTAAFGLLNHSSCSVGRMVGGQEVDSACPAPPIGPDGTAVTDSFYFVHQPLAGDGTITVRVAGLSGLYPPHGVPDRVPDPGPGSTAPPAGYAPGVQPWSKAGIMIKSSLTAGSAYAAMLVTGDNGVRMQSDFTGDVAGLPGTVTAAAPRWLRLVRAGDTITGYDSPDGSHWTRVSQVTLSGLPTTAQVGLFATSPSYVQSTQSLSGGSSGTGGPTSATGTFDQVNTTWRDGPWTATAVDSNSDSPGLRFAGYQHSGGTLTVTGSGDIGPDVPEISDGAGTSPTQALSAGTFFGLIVLVVIGAVFVTAEYRRGLIQTTFTAAPRRGRVLAAKALVAGAVAFLTGLIGTAIALPLSQASLRSGGVPALQLPLLTTIRVDLGVGLLAGLATVLALALGVILRRGVAAVTASVVLIGLPFLFSVITGLFPAGVGHWLLRLFPAAAFAVQQAFPAYHQVAGSYTVPDGYYPLPWWGGLLVLAAWTAAALAAAAYLLKRRDA